MLRSNGAALPRRWLRHRSPKRFARNRPTFRTRIASALECGSARCRFGGIGRSFSTPTDRARTTGCARRRATQSSPALGAGYQEHRGYAAAQAAATTLEKEIAIVVAACAATSKSSIRLPLAEPGARLFDALSRVDARPVRFRRTSRCDHFSRLSAYGPSFGEPGWKTYATARR